MCSVQIFKFLAKIYIINLIFSQEYIFIAFSQESAFSFSQVSNTHLAKIYTTRICVPEQSIMKMEGHFPRSGSARKKWRGDDRHCRDFFCTQRVNKPFM